MTALLLLQLALAADWSPTTWKTEASRDGVLTLPAGVPLRLLEEVEITSIDGQPVPLRAGETDWWIDPAPRTRLLIGPVDVGLLELDARQWEADWAAWEHDAALAIATVEPVPLPPDGTGAVASKIQARARAVGHRTALLGLLADITSYRGMSRLGTDRPGPMRRYVVEAGEALKVDRVGVIELGIRPMTGRFERIEVEVDGNPWAVASTGETSSFRSFLRVSGAPPLRLTGDPEVPVEVLVRRRPLRLWAVLPSLPHRARSGIEAAEWRALHGEEADFRPWLTDPDPATAEWARIRAIETAEGADLVELCDPALPGGDAVAHAVLARAADLPIDIPLDWLSQVDAPDPRVLADWLDGQQASRPHGVALLERARRGRIGDRKLARHQLRHGALHTRWSALSSDRDQEGTWQFTTEGAGIPRLQIRAGRIAKFRVNTVDPSLREAVRWTADEGTYFLLDGEWFSGSGELHLGLTAGEHVVEVEAGRLLVPQRGWTGGEPGVGWRAVPLPAVFELPGEGAPLELRLNAEEPVMLAFDDGRVVERAAGAGLVVAGPHAKRVEITGSGRVGVAARIVRVASAPVPVLNRADALEIVRLSTAQLDRGDLRARSRRAVALAMLGRRRLAWADTAALASIDGALFRDTWGQVASVPVMTEQTGPLDAKTAAAKGAIGASVALAALEDGDRVGAVMAAAAAEEAGVLHRALAGLRWRPIQRLDRGAGLRPVEISARPPKDDLRHEVERALILSPWPEEETVVVRAGAVDRILTPREGLELDIWCRDLSLGRSPCVLEAIGAQTPGAVVGDGEIAHIDVDGHVAEIGPVDRDQIVLVRAKDEAGVLSAGVRRLGLVVQGHSSVRLPADRLARVEVLSGDVQILADEITVVDGRSIVHPHGLLELSGAGTVLVAVSEEGERSEDEVELARPDRPRPIGLLQVDDLWPVLGRSSHRTLPGGPSYRVQLAGLLTVDGQFREPWATGELEFSALHAGPKGWSFAEGWMRAPGGIGFVAEGGVRQGRGLLSARIQGATTLRGDAGQLGLRAHGRLETGPRRLWLRGDLWARGAWVSLQPRRLVDPRVWSLYRLTHPMGLDGRLSVLSEFMRDLRLRAWVQGNSNVGASLDRVQLGARGDLLLRRRTRVFALGSVDLVFADIDRASGRITPSAGGGFDHDWWIGDRRWMLFGEMRSDPSGELFGTLGLSVHQTRGRGLRDSPPTRDLFRTEREGR